MGGGLAGGFQPSADCKLLGLPPGFLRSKGTLYNAIQEEK